MVKLLQTRSWKSVEYVCHARINCLLLLTHAICRALHLALLSAGKSMAARMAMMAMTTNSSMRVKARAARAPLPEATAPCRFGFALGGKEFIFQRCCIRSAPE